MDAKIFTGSERVPHGLGSAFEHGGLYLERESGPWSADDAEALKVFAGELGALLRAHSRYAEAAAGPSEGTLSHPAFLRSALHLLENSNRYGQPFSLLLIGIESGDGLLLPLREHLRSTDLVAQPEVGTWEVLLPSTDAASVAVVVRKLVESMEQRAQNAAQKPILCIGTATFPDNAADLASLFHHAFADMREARARGTTASDDLAFPASAWEVLRFAGAPGSMRADDWKTHAGEWELEGGNWVSKGAEDNVLVWKAPVAGSFRFICEGWNEHAGELCIFGHALEDRRQPHWGYAFHIGAEGNTGAKLTRQATTMLSIPGFQVEARKTYRLELDYHHAEGRVACFADGKRLFSYRDAFRFPGEELGFYAWGAGAHLRPVEVRMSKTPVPLSAMETADRLLGKGAYQEALERFEEISAQSPAALEGSLARFRQGQCLSRMDRRDAALEIFGALNGTPLEPYAKAEAATWAFEDRPDASPLKGTQLFEEILARFPVSEARMQIYPINMLIRTRARMFGPTRREDLEIRQRLYALAAHAQRPATQQQIRAQSEWGRCCVQLGRWTQAFDETLAFRNSLSSVQKTVASSHNNFHVLALALNRDEHLPAPPFDVESWEMAGYPDWCSGLAGHCVIRRGDPAAFVELARAQKANAPLSFNASQAVLLLLLALRRDAEAAAWLDETLLPVAQSEDYIKAYWIGGLLADARKDDLFHCWIAQMARTLLNAGLRSPVSRSLSVLKARWAIESCQWDTAARALQGLAAPDLLYHFSDGLLFQALLSSLGFLKDPPRTALAISVDRRLAGTEWELARAFLGQQEPKPTASWPHSLWRPEWRLWLALWLEHRGQKSEAREIASTCLDSRYGSSYLQPSFVALLSRCKTE
ncbi:MAG: diguanylate cyclase [Planctomycetes bacterium]|nr:diguanylate cyclase [Planctomycetota bacterium]